MTAITRMNKNLVLERLSLDDKKRVLKLVETLPLDKTPQWHNIQTDEWNLFCKSNVMSADELNSAAKKHATDFVSAAIIEFYDKRKTLADKNIIDSINAELKRAVSNREYQSVVNCFYKTPMPNNILECLNIAVEFGDKPIASYLGAHIYNDVGLKN